MVLNELININSSEQGPFLFLVSTLLRIVRANSNSSLTRINGYMGPVTRDCLHYPYLFFSHIPVPASAAMKDQTGSFLNGVPTYPGQTGRKCSHKSAGLPRCPSPRGRGHSQHQSTSLRRDKTRGLNRYPSASLDKGVCVWGDQY